LISIRPTIRIACPCRGFLPVWLLIICLCGPVEVMASGGGQTEIEIDTVARTIQVRNGNGVLLRLDDISIGRGGVASGERRRGDGTTPLGQFRIAEVDHDSQFDTFILINYPNRRFAASGLQRGDLSQAEYNAIEKALARGKLPPQNTAAGGRLGIHGIGDGDLRVHQEYNWTNGCVAVTNEQLHQLLPHVRPGMPVRIR